MMSTVMAESHCPLINLHSRGGDEGFVASSCCSKSFVDEAILPSTPTKPRPVTLSPIRKIATPAAVGITRTKKSKIPTRVGARKVPHNTMKQRKIPPHRVTKSTEISASCGKLDVENVGILSKANEDAFASKKALDVKLHMTGSRRNPRSGGLRNRKTDTISQRVNSLATPPKVSLKNFEIFQDEDDALPLQSPGKTTFAPIASARTADLQTLSSSPILSTLSDVDIYDLPEFCSSPPRLQRNIGAQLSSSPVAKGLAGKLSEDCVIDHTETMEKSTDTAELVAVSSKKRKSTKISKNVRSMYPSSEPGTPVAMRTQPTAMEVKKRHLREKQDSIFAKELMLQQEFGLFIDGVDHPDGEDDILFNTAASSDKENMEVEDGTLTRLQSLVRAKRGRRSSADNSSQNGAGTSKKRRRNPGRRSPDRFDSTPSKSPLNELYNAHGPHGYFTPLDDVPVTLSPNVQLWRGKSRVYPRNFAREEFFIDITPSALRYQQDGSSSGHLDRPASPIPFTPAADGFEFTGITVGNGEGSEIDSVTQDTNNAVGLRRVTFEDEMLL